jgi:hypothetical protein
MKLLVTITASTVALLAGTAPALADVDGVGQSRATASLSMHDQKALNACADAFLAKIAPANTAKVQVHVPPILGKKLSRMQPGFSLEVTMEARTASHVLLAESTCEVDYEARVTRLDTSVPNPSMLAGLAPKDIHLGIVGNM